MVVLKDLISGLLARIIGVKNEGITKLQSEKIAKIAMPRAWHVKFGKLEWLDEGLGERIIVLEKDIAQKSASEELTNAWQEISFGRHSLETSKKASRYRQLYRILLYNGLLLEDDKGKEIIGQTLVLFFRPSNSITRQMSFRESRISMYKISHREYESYFFGLTHIYDNSVRNAAFINRIGAFSEVSTEFDRIAALCDGSSQLLWSELQRRVEIPVGCFPKRLTDMVLGYFLNTKDITQEEYEYLMSITDEEELNLDQQQLLETVKKNYKIALQLDKDSDWDK